MTGSQILWLSIFLTAAILFGFNYPLILFEIVIMLGKTLAMIMVWLWFFGATALYDNDIDLAKKTLNPVYWLIYRPVDYPPA